MTKEQIKTVEDTLIDVMKENAQLATSKDNWQAVVEVARTLIELYRVNPS